MLWELTAPKPREINVAIPQAKKEYILSLQAKKQYILSWLFTTAVVKVTLHPWLTVALKEPHLLSRYCTGGNGRDSGKRIVHSLSKLCFPIWTGHFHGLLPLLTKSTISEIPMAATLNSYFSAKWLRKQVAQGKYNLRANEASCMTLANPSLLFW